MRAPAQIAPIGLARPCPAISGAEPCTGSNSDGWDRVGSRFALAARPRLPCNAAPRSVRMSAKRFDPTTTSMVSGRGQGFDVGVRARFLEPTDTGCVPDAGRVSFDLGSLASQEAHGSR